MLPMEKSVTFTNQDADTLTLRCIPDSSHSLILVVDNIDGQCIFFYKKLTDLATMRIYCMFSYSQLKIKIKRNIIYEA
jgi:hypothetical protein